MDAQRQQKYMKFIHLKCVTLHGTRVKKPNTSVSFARCLALQVVAKWLIALQFICVIVNRVPRGSFSIHAL